MASAVETIDAERTNRRYRTLKTVKEILRYTILILALLIFIIPCIWVWSSALKTSIEISQDPFSLPADPQWSNLTDAWTIGRFGKYIGNSVIYAIVIVGGICFLSCLAGYALASADLPGGRLIFIFFLLGLMVPFQSIMIPLYYLARDLDILGTRLGMILPSIALGVPFGIFLMRSFFKGLPSELADAGRIDGCNEWGVFWRVMLPLAWPGLTSLAVFQFLWTWNSFVLPLVLVQREELRPMALGIMFFFGRYTANRGMIAAGMTLASLPVVLLYFILQRQFIAGITKGALKS
jgi:ABC-type glycerol-3-phosphate transport system permease component